jgi:hypothetical protein
MRTGKKKTYLLVLSPQFYYSFLSLPPYLTLQQYFLQITSFDKQPASEGLYNDGDTHREVLVNRADFTITIKMKNYPKIK